MTKLFLIVACLFVVGCQDAQVPALAPSPLGQPAPIVLTVQPVIVPVETAIALCGSFPAEKFGHYFFCATSQANVQPTSPFPDHSLGYCQAADEPLDLVGYSVPTIDGQIFPVMSWAGATDIVRVLSTTPHPSAGLIACVREMR